MGLDSNIALREDAKCLLVRPRSEDADQVDERDHGWGATISSAYEDGAQ